MRPRVTFQHCVLVVILACPLGWPVAVAAAERLQEIEARIQLQAERRSALSRLGANVEVRYGHHGTVRSIIGDLKLVAPGAESSAIYHAEILETLRVPLGLAGSEALVQPTFHPGPAGTSTIRYRQEIDGIPVVGASLAISFRESGSADEVSAKLLADDGLAREPSVTLDVAKTKAIEAVSETLKAAVEAYRLVYYYSAEERGALAWVLECMVSPTEFMSTHATGNHWWFFR